MVGKNRDPDVSATPFRQLVMKGAKTEITFQGAEGIFDTGESNVQFPQLLIRQVKGTAQMITAVKLSGCDPLFFPAFPIQLTRLFIITDTVKL